MAHCQSPHASSSLHSDRKLFTSGTFFCSSGLKDVCFNDVGKRVFHSTYRATHHLMANIARILPLYDGSSRVCSPLHAEETVLSEETNDGPEGPICIVDGAQQDSSCKVQNYVQTSIGCIDTQIEQGNIGGFDASTMLSTYSGASSHFSSEPLQNGHANAPLSFPSSEGVDDPTTLGLCISYLELQESYGVSEFCIENPEAPETSALQPEVKSWDLEGLGTKDAKDSFCTVKNVCGDDDKRENLASEENGEMAARIGICSTERVDIEDSFSRVENARKNDDDYSGKEDECILTACVCVRSTRLSDVKDTFCTIEDFCINEEENGINIGGCLSDALMQENEVVCTDTNSLDSPSYTSNFWKGANTNHCSQKSKLSACRWRRIWKVVKYMAISSVVICDTHTKKKLFFRCLPTSWFRLTLQRLAKLLKSRNFDLEVAVAVEQLMAYTNVYLRICRSRHSSTPGRRALAASCYSRLFLGKQSPSVEKELTMGDRQYKKVNVHIISSDHQKCHSKGSKNHVSSKCFFLEHNILRVEQEGQYASMPSSKVGEGSTSSPSCSLEPTDEKFPRSTEPSSVDCDWVSKILHGSLQHDNQRTSESDQSSHNLLSGTSSGSTSKFPNLVEVRDGGMTRSRELPLKEMDDCKEDIRESSGFPSQTSVNEVDDWTSVPADQVDKCLDTCLYHLQHHPTCFFEDLTPELKLLDCVMMRNPFQPANGTSNSLNGSQIFELHANGNENSASCLSIAKPHSHTLFRCIPSLSFDGEDLRSSMPFGGVYEKQSKKKLEHFADGFLLRRHIRRQQRKAQQAPPYPPRDSAGYAHKNQGVDGKPLGVVKPKSYAICSIENNNEPAMTLTPSITENDRLVGADVVIDMVGLITCIESQCGQVNMFSDSAANTTNYTDLPLLGGQVVNLNLGAVIVTIIAIVVYTRTLLEGGLAWVGAQTQKEEDN